jgi:predicted nucleic acid-binding protein
MSEELRWVMDTSAFTHMCRAGHAEIIEGLAPGGIVLIPDAVNLEIEHGRQTYSDIPAVSSIRWAEIAVLSEEETWTQLTVKAQLGGRPSEHLGECAVIACAHHRAMAAILDDRAAVEQADLLGVPHHDTLWLVVGAYRKLFDLDRARTVKVVDDLLATGMYLPIDSGESFLAWAFEAGLLP